MFQEKTNFKYMLLMYANELETPEISAEEQRAVSQAWYDLGEEAEGAGVLLSNNGLSSVADATTLCVRSSKSLPTDYPFAETHEQLAGYYLLDCKDFDEAIGRATKIPLARYGSIEIHPINAWSNEATRMSWIMTALPHSYLRQL